MGFEGLSSSVVIALAAVLWLVYLVPTWLRRREYLATERNAVRLQQTLRIMAETAQVPEQIRAETTARSVAAQEKILQREMQRTQAIARAQDAAAARAAARKLAETQPAIAASVARSSQASRRLRKSRALATMVLVASLVAAGFGFVLAGSGGVPLLVGGAVIAVGAAVMLAQIAQVSKTRRELARTLDPVRRAEVFEPEMPVREVTAQPERTSWTPVPIPKPLYLSRPVIPSVPATDSAVLLKDAADQAVGELRAAQHNVTPILRPGEAAPSNRFSQMGIVEVGDTAVPDIDAVLRRRRAV